MRTTDFPRSQVDRMLERSGERALRRAREQLRKIDRDRKLLRTVFQILTRGVTGTIGGVLFPGDVAPGTIFTPEELERERAKQLKPIEVPENVRRIRRLPSQQPSGTPVPRELEEITAPGFPRRLESIRVPQIPRRDPVPVRQPSAPAPRRSPAPSGTTQRQLGPFTSILASSIISQLIRSRSSRPVPFRDPIQPPLGRPFVPTTPGPTTQPLPTRQRTGTVDDLCRARARQQRKKRRKCDQRLNVVWAGGPNKGKIAGSKCFRFGN